MKKLNLKLAGFITLLILSSACASIKHVEETPSLYKTPEGRNTSFRSYDSALTLFTCMIEEDYVKTDYGSTHVLISGDTNSEPIFLIPGLFGDASMWYANMGELSKHYRVYALDMPNYGGKSIPNINKVAEFNDYKLWFTQLLEHYNIEKTSIVGISYSSWLALSLAREMQEQISSIILLDPSETFMPMNGGITWKGFKAFMFFPNRSKQSNFLDWLGGGYTDSSMTIWREHMLDVMEFGSTKMFDVPQHRIYNPEELLMVKIPVLVMAGGKPILYEDPQIFKENAQKAIPHAVVVIVPNAGHGLNMEKPEIVNEQIIDFLRNNN